MSVSTKGTADEPSALAPASASADDRKLLHYLLGRGSRPLVIPAQRMLVFWSPKAGCTFIVKWAFRQAGLLPAANFYSRWPHNYRMEVYYKSDGYERAINAFVNQPGPVVKLVRNPFDRAVSSFIHAVRTGYADGLLSTKEHRQQHGISFRDFVSWLENDQDLAACNPHHGLQYHPAEERLRIDHLLKLETVIAQLEELCERYGLNGKNLEQLSRSHHHTKRSRETRPVTDERFFGSEEHYPPYPAFYDSEVQGRVRALYARDFEAYAYEFE